MIPESEDTCDEEIHCEISVPQKFSVDSFCFDDKSINYYTGFDDYDHFMLFFSCFRPAAYELKYQCLLLPSKDKPVLQCMTLMKLRQAKDYVELALFFKVSELIVSRIVVQLIKFLYFQFKELDIWPSKDVVQETMHAVSKHSSYFGCIGSSL